MKFYKAGAIPAVPHMYLVYGDGGTGKVITGDGELVEGANLKQREAGWRIKNKPEGTKNWKEI